MGRAFWIVVLVSAFWAAVIGLSFIAPRYMAPPGHSGWDALGRFLEWQLAAFGIMLLDTALTVVFWAMGRIGILGRVIGLTPAVISAGSAVYFTVFLD